MFFVPLDRMLERVENGKSESNVNFFNDLMYTGEMLVKIITLGLVATIEDSRDNHRYRMYYNLVRADGIGSWVKVAEDVLIGPAAQYVVEEAIEDRRQLSEKILDGWQSSSVRMLHECLKIVVPDIEDLPTKIDARKWLDLFARLRNKTRGHGAVTGEQCNNIVEKLEESILLFINNYVLFKRPWAYLHKNLSGKYRVSKITPSATELNYLKSTTEVTVPNGIYVVYGKKLCLVELFQTDVDLSDFYISNGGFTEKKYELLSYITNTIRTETSDSYLAPVSQLPRSETQSLKDLDLIGETFTNLPSQITGYINRPVLENELLKVLRDDRHPIITLTGRGGIGKTSLALYVLHEIAKESKFKLIVWFSARDIDLLENGPKQVKPDVITLKEIATEYWSLVDRVTLKENTQKQIELFAHEMNELQGYGPILFIFDNFETVSNPLELYNFIDTHIRNPNKVLITTRHREFKSDYPIEVKGMSREECDKLVQSTAHKLGLEHLLTDQYLEELYHESEGHPYVVKIILGERAKPGSNKSINRILTNREDILEALFERTYTMLSEGAKRVFFTLCNWRSVLPLLAVEAALLRSMNKENKFDIKEAVDELERVSFIEVVASEIDEQLFLSVPLAAALFGKKKLSISPLRSIVEADTQLLYFFGAAQKNEVKCGIEPRILKLFKNIARDIVVGKSNLDNYLPMLEFIARQYPPAWIYVASLCEELNCEDTFIKNYLYNYLESSDKKQAYDVWSRIASLSLKSGKLLEYFHAKIEKCILPETPFNEISGTANEINYKLSKNELLDNEELMIMIGNLALIMEERIDEGDATDCSRLCWLLLRLNEEEKAIKYLQKGLEMDPYNIYCNRLKEKLNL